MDVAPEEDAEKSGDEGVVADRYKRLRERLDTLQGKAKEGPTLIARKRRKVGDRSAGEKEPLAEAEQEEAPLGPGERAKVKKKKTVEGVGVPAEGESDGGPEGRWRKLEERIIEMEEGLAMFAIDEKGTLAMTHERLEQAGYRRRRPHSPKLLLF